MSLAIPLENIRGVNQAVLWRLFFGHGPVNQKSIAREIHYSEKSVTRAFRFLRQYDFVEFCRGGWVLKPEVGDDMLQGIEVSAAYRRRTGSDLPAANGSYDHWADQQDKLDDEDDGTFDHCAGVEDLAEDESDGHFDHSAVEKDEETQESDRPFDHCADQQDQGGEKADGHFDHPDVEENPDDGHFDHPDAEENPDDGHFDHPEPEKIPDDGHFDHPEPEKIPGDGHFDHPDPQKNPENGTFVDSGSSKIEATRLSTIIINTDSLNQNQSFNNNNSSASAKINKDPGDLAHIWRELSRMRIYQNPRTLGMVQLAHVTPEYVGALMDQFEAEGRGGVGWSGLFIQHCERNEPIHSRHSQIQEQFDKFFCREV